MPPRPAKPDDYVGLRRRSMPRSRAASPPGASRAGCLRCAGAAVGPSSGGMRGITALAAYAFVVHGIARVSVLIGFFVR